MYISDFREGNKCQKKKKDFEGMAIEIIISLLNVFRAVFVSW